MQFKDSDKNKLLPLLNVSLIYGFTVRLWGCPIKFFSGISCPACGMTRAWYRMLCGDLTGAFFYHPLFLLGPVLLGIIILEGVRSRQRYKILLISLGVLFLGVYFLRMFIFQNDIVTIELDQSVFLKVYRWIDNTIKHI